MQITITQPDDWHLHLRDGEALAAVLPHSARQFARYHHAQSAPAGNDRFGRCRIPCAYSCRVAGGAKF